jgi:hypothetical protein
VKDKSLLVLLGLILMLLAISVGRVLREAWASGPSARLVSSAPEYLAPPPLYSERGLDRPWRVGVQAGHWRIEELPNEQAHLRDDTGARYGALQEAEVNLAIARRVARDLASAGVAVDLLPATVPPGYDADAFVAIHADGGAPRERGFKVSVPWRASEASLLLQESIERAYADLSSIPRDRYGVTYNMRGYYGFSWYRFSHAVAASTPCAIIETGYLTSRADRAVIVDDPETPAAAIAAGIIAYLGRRPTLRPGDLVARAYAPMIVGPERATLRFLPGDDEPVAATLPSGTVVRPMQVEKGWVELMQWGNFHVFGWMKLADLQPPG